MDISTVPQIVNITHYGGDTLTIKVTLPATSVEPGQEWSAQVKGERGDVVPDAEFDITPPVAPSTSAYLVLPASVTEDLVLTKGVLIKIRQENTTKEVMRYNGEWDCQVSSAGGADPVFSLAQGKFVVEMDVTRAEP